MDELVGCGKGTKLIVTIRKRGNALVNNEMAIRMALPSRYFLTASIPSPSPPANRQFRLRALRPPYQHNTTIIDRTVYHSS